MDYLMSTENHLNSEDKESFLKTCRNFLIKAAEELQTRLQLDEKLITLSYFFHPNNAVSEKFRETVPKLDQHFEINPSEISND